MATTGLDKRADLAGPGIGTYEDLEKVLPDDYESLLNPKDTQKAITAVKRFIEDRLCQELNLMRVEVPLIVDAESGINDLLDRDGSRGPIQFHISNDRDTHPIDSQVVQAATKWKRFALKQFGMRVGEGLITDMRAVRKDYFLDHDHSAYVDQWDWERVITPEKRSLDFLTRIVKRIWKVIVEAEGFALREFPRLRTKKYPPLPERLTFLHAEEILERYPDLPRKARETAILQEYPAIFIYGIGWTLADGYPHEMRAADARSQRGHPGLEPGDPPAARAELDGHPRRRCLAPKAARAHGAARFPQVPLSSGHHSWRAAAQHRGRHRPIADAHAAAPQGPPGRGERDGLAEGAQGDVREAADPRPRVRSLSRP